MKNPLMIPELKELLKKKKIKVLESFLKDGHAREIAELIEMLPPEAGIPMIRRELTSGDNRGEYVVAKSLGLMTRVRCGVVQSR